MSPINGQNHLLHELDSALTGGRLAHAYLLVGPNHIGKMSLAIHFAQRINCLKKSDSHPCQECIPCKKISNAEHPDVRIETISQSDEEPNRTRIRRLAILEIIHSVQMTPYESSHRIIIFDGAESLSGVAANTLLKTLEEPPENVIFLLLTDRENLVLPTIRSRCRKLQLRQMPKLEISNYLINKHDVEPELAEQLGRLSKGCLGWAINAVTDEETLTNRVKHMNAIYKTSSATLQPRFDYASEIAEAYRKNRVEAKEVLFLWERWWRDLLLIKIGTEDFILNLDYINELRLHASGLTQTDIVNFLKGLEDTIGHLDRNVNAQLAMEVLMLNLPESNHLQAL